MRWIRIGKANISSAMRDAFDQAGTSIVQQLMFSGMINTANLPAVLQQLGQQSEERKAAFKWLTEMADRADRRETWNLTMEAAITVFVLMSLGIEVWNLFKH